MNESLQKVNDLKLCYNCLSNSHLKTKCICSLSPLQNSMPRTQLWNFPPHLSPHSTPKRPSQSQQKIPRLTKGQVLANPIYNLTTKVQERQRHLNAPRIRTKPPDNHNSTQSLSTKFPKIFSPLFRVSPFPSSMETKPSKYMP